MKKTSTAKKPVAKKKSVAAKKAAPVKKTTTAAPAKNNAPRVKKTTGARKAVVVRKTRETDIKLAINLDGTGKSDIRTPIPFFTHMLTNFSRHGLFDLKLRLKGDIEVDLHHTVEDAGLALGEAVKKALRKGAGVTRCGSATVPMMDSLSTVVLDISNRPYFKFNSTKKSFSVLKNKIFSAISEDAIDSAFNVGLVTEFMRAFSNSAGVDLHITLHYGDDIHHSIESIFKALGRALSAAARRDTRVRGVMSTKGML